jgi:hypothetical protein
MIAIPQVRMAKLLSFMDDAAKPGDFDLMMYRARSKKTRIRRTFKSWSGKAQAPRGDRTGSPRAGGVPKPTSDEWSELHQDVGKMRRCLRCQYGSSGLRLDNMCAPATTLLEHGLLERARIQRLRTDQTIVGSPDAAGFGEASPRDNAAQCISLLRPGAVGPIRRRSPPFGLARNGEFIEPDQSDATSPVPFAKIFLFSHPPNHF